MCSGIDGEMALVLAEAALDSLNSHKAVGVSE